MVIFGEHVALWYRYIDNVFAVWEGPTDLLQNFLTSINNNLLNLSFTMSYDIKLIPFLYINICKDSNRYLCSSLYRKPMAGKNILHVQCKIEGALNNRTKQAMFIQDQGSGGGNGDSSTLRAAALKVEANSKKNKQKKRCL